MRDSREKFYRNESLELQSINDSENREHLSTFNYRDLNFHDLRY